MKQKIDAKDSGVVLLYIVDQFRTFGGDCGKELEFPAPPRGYEFEVVEPIETCHPVCGLGLEKINGCNCLPVGRYMVMECECDPRYARKLHLERNIGEDLERNVGERVWCYYGNDKNQTMDWRGIKSVARTIAA
jgi:hypothetical protein